MPSISQRSAQQPPAEREILVAQDDARAGARRRPAPPIRPAGPPPITSTSQKAIGLLVGGRDRRAGGAAEAGGAADQRLVDLLPEGGRPHEGLVVEAGARSSGRQQRVHRQQVEAQRRPAVLARGVEPVVELDRRRPRVRLAPRAGAQLDQRIRLLRAGGEDAARAVILERAADQRARRWRAAPRRACRRHSR